MQIGLLGPLEVRADSGDVVEVGGARLRTLLILLALEPGRVVTTSRLIDALWGDTRPAGAANALQALVSRLRRTVPDLPIESRPAGYLLAVDPDAVDLRRFERLAAAGRHELGHAPAMAAATLRSALALWRGPALADVEGADFAQAPVARLTELRLTAIEDRIEADLRTGVGPALIAELEELVAANPLREPLVGQLMRALTAAGRPGDALAAYEQARARLADQLGVDPSPDLAALHLAVLRGDRLGGVRAGPSRATGPEPSPSSVDSPRTNLRAGLTSFVGRDEDVERVGALVRESRLTTLTGPGGAGKTRLAIESARVLLESMRDGVWLVRLAPVTDPAEVVPAVLAAVGLREQALLTTATRRGPAVELPADPTSRLIAGLAGRSLLLLLDNCEHLVEEVAQVADRILGDCPGVRILATSREPIGITGETLWPVEPLDLPPPDADAATALKHAAVRLFADRAASARPGFTVETDNAAAVVRICRALDGMPLAIELAAARLRAMTPEQIDARLGDRFRLLTGGSRTALPRHRTLQAVVDWSWDLLDDEERALWRRLAVFPGGATTESAEQVCAGDGVAAEDVVDLLTALVDKSLLVPTGDDPPRYRMLETIRAYGLDRLAEAGEADRTGRAHAAYFRARAETAEPHLRAHEQLYWLARLTAEHENLHAAVREAVAAGDAETAVRLVAALGWYWWLRGHRAEGAELAGLALAVPGEVPTEARAVAYALGALNVFEGGQDQATAYAWIQAALAAIPAGQVRSPLLRLIHPAGLLIQAYADGGEARAMDALRRLYDDADVWVGATARLLWGFGSINLGMLHADVEADCREAVARYRAVGDRWGAAFALSALGELTALGGNHAASAGHYAEALRLLDELGTSENSAFFQTVYARQLWLTGDTDRAKAVLAEALYKAQRTGMPEYLAAVEHAQAEIARLEGDLDTARALVDSASALAQDQTVSPQWRAYLATSMGQIDLAEGDLDAARDHLAVAVEDAVASRDAPVVGLVLVAVADLALHRGDPAQAATLLAASASVTGGADASAEDRPRVEAAARAALGDAWFAAAYQRGRDATVGSVIELTGLRPGV